MFSTLLDSSPLRQPVLKRLHWGLSLLAGVAGFGIALSVLHAPSLYRLPLIGAAGAGLLCAVQALMLCYVSADAGRLGLRSWPWLLVTLSLSLGGFLIYLAYSARKAGDWKRAAIPMAYVFEIGLLGLMVMLPLIYTQALPESQWIREMIGPPDPPARYHAPSRPAGTRPVYQATLAEITVPLAIPRSVPRIVDVPEPLANFATGDVGVPGALGDPNGVPHSLSGFGTPPPPPPPPPAPLPVKKPPSVVRVGGEVEAARLIYRPRLEYPLLAREAHVQGTVKIEALISADGTIEGLKLISGPVLLTQAAMDAVARWRYQPTLLNGDPVQVVTEIDVVFTLAE